MKITSLSTLALATLLALSNCEQAPQSDKAKTEDAKKVDDTKAKDASELTLDIKASEVTWVGTKPTGKHAGTFGIKEGKISVKEGQITAGSFTLDVAALKVTDIPADNEMNGKLAGHLTSEDFFDAKKFPSAKFEITAVAPYKKDEKATEDKKDAEYTLKDPTHTITGNLELKGVTKSISFPAKVTLGEGKASAEAKFTIDRKDWKVNHGKEESVGDKVISNTVFIGLKLAAGAGA